MKINWFLLFSTVLIVCSCRDNKYDPAEYLDNDQYANYLKHLAPYLNKKPDEITYADRFTERMRPYYQTVVNKTQGRIQYYLKKDTAHFFFYQYKDLTSLFEHYRGFGGYFKTNDNDSIHFVNLLYHTPRLTKDEMTERGEILFNEMTTNGSVSNFLNNRNFIHTPNNDFYYNVKENRWDYTDQSSWKFLQEEKARYEPEGDSI